MKMNDVYERVAQMLYDKAELMSLFEDNAVSDEMKTAYEIQCQTFCAAAEYVRQMKEDG